MELNKDVVITTPRMIIRKPVLNDLAALHAAKEAVWSELQNWMSWASDAQAGIEATRDFIENVPNVLCGFDRETGDFIVASGFGLIGDHKYEIGYWVAPKYLGKGYATEVTNAILRYTFNVLGFKTMYTGYYEGNEKSKNVMLKLGFEFLKTEPKIHQQFSSGIILDKHIYIRHNADNLPELEVTWS